MVEGQSLIAPHQCGQFRDIDGELPSLFLGENVLLQSFGFGGSAVDVHEDLAVSAAHHVAALNLFDALVSDSSSIARFPSLGRVPRALFASGNFLSASPDLS